MFVGEAMCLFYKLVMDWQNSRLKRDSWEEDNAEAAFNAHNRPLLDKQDTKRPHIMIFCLLACFDLSATALGGVGLLWVTASANQMLRGSMIFFTGVFSVIIFRRNLGWRKWLGIAIVMVGLVLVGATGMLRPSSDNSHSASAGQVLTGLLLITAGSALNSLQNVLEEMLLKGATVDPLEVVGWEGCFGCLMCVTLLLPTVQAIKGDDVGCQENTRDSLMMLTGNPGMTFVVLGYAIALAVMNFYSQVVAKYLSAVHRMLMSTLRTVLVWVVNLIIFYVIPKGDEYGEDWDRYSWLQLGGFLILIFGTFVYMTGASPPKHENTLEASSINQP